MSAAPFPEHGRDGDEPEGFVPLPAGDEDWDEEGVQQGLYVTLPAEELTLAGFAGDGRADTMAPGPLLAAVLSAVAGEDGKGLAGLSDDQLIGFLSGARRMESLAAWTQMPRCHHPAPRHLRRAGRGEDPPGSRADHRGRDQHPRRRCRGRRR